MERLVRDYMTSSPIVIERSATLAEAHALMKKHGIRHLPVVEKNELCGLLSLREVQFIELLSDVEPSLIIADTVMVNAPYSVPPIAKVRDVAAAMTQHKYGSAVVEEHGKVVGVFTTIDALRALMEFLDA